VPSVLIFTVCVQLNTINIKCKFLFNSYGNSVSPSTVQQITPYINSSCFIYSFHLNKGTLTATNSKLLHSYPTQVCVSTAVYIAFTNAEFYIRLNDCVFEETKYFLFQNGKSRRNCERITALLHYPITGDMVQSMCSTNDAVLEVISNYAIRAELAEIMYWHPQI